MYSESYVWRKVVDGRLRVPLSVPLLPWVDHFSNAQAAIAWRQQLMFWEPWRAEVASWVLCRQTLAEVGDSALPPTGQALACVLNDGETWTDADNCCVVDYTPNSYNDLDEAVQNTGRVAVELDMEGTTLHIRIYPENTSYDIRVSEIHLYDQTAPS